MVDLSIVVPIYNVEDYLAECLASIEAALCYSFSAEIICVNDGSQDSSEQIATRFAQRDSRFQVISHSNGGYGKAINAGINIARGHFLTIVESDDIITAGAYPLLVELLRQNESLDFVKTPYQPFTANGPGSYISVPPCKLSATDILYSSGRSVKTMNFTSDLLILEPPAIWAGVYRRSSLNKYGIKLPETTGAGYQDTCFSAMCFLNNLTYYWVADRYYMYRVDREAASRHSRTRRSEMIFLFDFIKKNLKHNGTWVESVKPYFYAVYFRRLIWFMQRVQLEHRLTLFVEAYHSFENVWKEPPLRAAVRGLLSTREVLQLEQFRQGLHAELYAG